jgi:ABC-type lipoprotein export system ATPase subunit
LTIYSQNSISIFGKTEHQTSNHEHRNYEFTDFSGNGLGGGKGFLLFLIYFVEILTQNMKVKELYIKDYHQFEDFRLDLTYPEGHPKAGQPLDKVCFIGQSGTGKTSLLEVIRKIVIVYLQSPFVEAFLVKNVETPRVFENYIFSPVKNLSGQIVFIDLLENDNHHNTSIESVVEVDGNTDKGLISIEFEDFFQYESSTYLHLLDRYLKILDSRRPLIISTPADINFKEFDSIPKEDSSLKNLMEIDISLWNFNMLWKNVEKELIKYREDEIKERLIMSERIQNSSSNRDDILRAVEEFEKWQSNTINPIIGLSTLLNKILNKFNLQVRTKLDFQKTEDISSIKVETLQGEEVMNAFLSTGTKQVLLTALPLYSSSPENAVIFFDEPERSLYPDIQKEIVDIYTSLTTDCQFFYATHSPIIASSFEPWEIVELKFNPKTGKVYQELYYEGERHVDNYTINPQYLRWDDILQRVFDLDSEGNEKRVKALMKLATLESKLKKKDVTSEEKEKLWNEYLKLSKLTGWTTRMTNEKN